MSIERIEKLESTVTLHNRRLDDHAKLHARHIASDGEHAKIITANTASIAALEKNTEVTTNLTKVITNLVDALKPIDGFARGVIRIAVAVGIIAGFFTGLFYTVKATILEWWPS
jgi:TRAP-type uncharacterized transport system fused permease subunit